MKYKKFGNCGICNSQQNLLKTNLADICETCFNKFLVESGYIKKSKKPVKYCENCNSTIFPAMFSQYCKNPGCGGLKNENKI